MLEPCVRWERLPAWFVFTTAGQEKPVQLVCRAPKFGKSLHHLPNKVDVPLHVLCVQGAWVLMGHWGDASVAPGAGICLHG